MVIINTENNKYSNLDFQHLVEVPECDCVIVTARERATGRTHLFLIVNHKGKIYSRKGINRSWVELDNQEEYRIRQLVINAIKSNVPYYTTNHKIHLQ